MELFIRSVEPEVHRWRTEWLDRTLRYLLFAHAGGVVVVAAFISDSDGAARVVWFIAALFFIAGVLRVGIIHYRQVSDALRVDTHLAELKSKLKNEWKFFQHGAQSVPYDIENIPRVYPSLDQSQRLAKSLRYVGTLLITGIMFSVLAANPDIPNMIKEHLSWVTGLGDDKNERGIERESHGQLGDRGRAVDEPVEIDAGERLPGTPVDGPHRRAGEEVDEPGER